MTQRVPLNRAFRASLGWRPIWNDAGGDDCANFVQGLKKDWGRDFRAKADVDAEFESARDPIERVALRCEPENFRRVTLADRLEETNGRILVSGHYFRLWGTAPAGRSEQVLR